MEIRTEANTAKQNNKRDLPTPVAVDEMLLAYILLSRKSIVGVPTSILGSDNVTEKGQADAAECFVMHVPFNGSC
jgi:hypothetical protein